MRSRGPDPDGAGDPQELSKLHDSTTQPNFHGKADPVHGRSQLQLRASNGETDSNPAIRPPRLRPPIRPKQLLQPILTNSSRHIPFPIVIGMARFPKSIDRIHQYLSNI